MPFMPICWICWLLSLPLLCYCAWLCECVWICFEHSDCTHIHTRRSSRTAGYLICCQYRHNFECKLIWMYHMTIFVWICAKSRDQIPNAIYYSIPQNDAREWYTYSSTVKVNITKHSLIFFFSRYILVLLTNSIYIHLSTGTEYSNRKKKHH